MNQTGQKCTFSLARDYVTFIKYEKGGFFDWHVDHEKVRINHGENGFKEMHFIYCVQGCLEGGQLLIKKRVSADGLLPQQPEKEKIMEISVEEARISNAGVVFDKSMEHKGAEVLEGTKIIMTIDLYVVSELRLKAGLTCQQEEEMSQLLANSRDWISFGGNAKAFQLAWDTVISTKLQQKLVDGTKEEFVPFLEIKLLKSETENYHIFSCHSGILFVRIEREDPSTGDLQKFEFDGKGISVWPKYNKKHLETNHKLQADSKKKAETEKILYYPDITDLNVEDENGDLYETVVKIAETLNQSSGNPSDLLCALLYDVGLMGGEDQVQEWPEIVPINKLIQPDLLPKQVDDEIQYYVNHEAFEKWAWAETKAGYSYYCNEPNYDSFDVHYRYGFVRNCYKHT
jgi:hypothetical protein